MPEKHTDIVGCVAIDDPTSGENRLSGLSFAPGLAGYPFDWRAGERAFEEMQTLLQCARSDCGAAAILARGPGCMAALALAEQLPVERLALIAPQTGRLRGRGSLARYFNRIALFARQNLSLCVSDVLIIEAGNSRVGRKLVWLGLGAHSRVAALEMPAETGPELYTICENALKTAITDFLRGGELPKDLAQNREMCIIYE